MSETWTIRRIVKWISDDLAGRQFASPRLDAELIVAQALALDRVKLYLDLDRPLAAPELAEIRALVARRRKHEPMAYLRGRREFFGRDMIVTPAVLVPRPETETLVERALELLPKESAGRVLDLCTGSGCIGVTLLAERPSLHGVLTDLSPDALAVAKQNAEKYDVVSRADLREGDLFGALPADAEPFDLVVANPPYIAARERAALDPDVRDFEPAMALFADDEGLAIVRRIAEGAAARTKAGASLLIEIGAAQGPATRAILESAGYVDVRIHADLAQRDRVAEGRR